MREYLTESEAWCIAAMLWEGPKRFGADLGLCDTIHKLRLFLDIGEYTQRRMEDRMENHPLYKLKSEGKWEGYIAPIGQSRPLRAKICWDLAEEAEREEGK